MTDLSTQDPSTHDVSTHDLSSHEEELRRRSLLMITAAIMLLVISTPLFLWYRATTSSAAFSDAEVLEKNRLGAATLDLEVGDGSARFEASNLAPGDMVSGQLELVNAGTLPLLFELRGVTDGDLLGEWIRFEIWTQSSDCSVQDTAPRVATDLTFGTASEIPVAASSPAAAQGRLAAGERRTLCLGARLLLEAPNQVQGHRTEIDLVIDAVHDIESETAGANR